MRYALLLFALTFVTYPSFGWCEPKIEVAEETLHQAKDQNFKYEFILDKAESGDKEAIAALLRFDKSDAAGALGHGVVLIELADLIGDKTFADVVRVQDFKTRRAVARYLEAGVAYTTNPRLQKPIRIGFPLTASALGQQSNP